MDQAIAGEMSESHSRTRINYAKWIWRVVTWDGILPLVMFGLPHAIRAAFPNVNLDRAEAVIITPPVIALLVRLFVGYHFISTNGCSDWWKAAQQLSLVCGIFPLSFFDIYMAASVLNAGNANGGPFFQLSLFFFAMALPFLIFAMYPGREPIPSTQIGNWEIEC